MELRSIRLCSVLTTSAADGLKFDITEQYLIINCILFSWILNWSILPPPCWIAWGLSVRLPTKSFRDISQARVHSSCSPLWVHAGFAVAVCIDNWLSWLYMIIRTYYQKMAILKWWQAWNDTVAKSQQLFLSLPVWQRWACFDHSWCGSQAHPVRVTIGAWICGCLTPSLLFFVDFSFWDFTSQYLESIYILYTWYFIIIVL